MKWDDVVCANRYQKNLVNAYRTWELENINPTGEEENPSEQEQQQQQQDQLPMPKDLFDGPTFHSLMLNAHSNANPNLASVAAAAAAAAAVRKKWWGNVGDNFGEPSSVERNGSEDTSLPPRALSLAKHQRQSLPIDVYKGSILEHIRKYSVTVIKGETGNGKSSRVPIMLIEERLERIRLERNRLAALGEDELDEEAEGGRGKNGEDLRRPKIIVSQPRRAAAQALTRRLRSESLLSGSRWSVGLRLGQGTREGPNNAEVTFATTGYLVNLIPNWMDSFHDLTHLIIDEVRRGRGGGRIFFRFYFCSCFELHFFFFNFHFFNFSSYIHIYIFYVYDLVEIYT